MILAQALGEYAAMAAIAEAATRVIYQIEEVIGTWGTEAIVAFAVVAVIWRLVAGKR
jgi:hypothetical protein